MPKQPAFHARLNTASNQNASSSDIHLTYGDHSVAFNIGSHYKTSGSDQFMFVAPVAGTYFFTANLRVDGFGGSYSYLSLYKINVARNSNSLYSRDLTSVQATYKNHVVTAVMNMAVDEAAWVAFREVGDGSVGFDSDSFFSGYLIG